MMSSRSTKNINKKASASIGGVAGGKTARACEGCLKRRARWYCAADDAFLCQPCDNSVHSANSLARRHQRVRLKTSSSASPTPPSSSLPAWHRGFTRKPRTPRSSNKHVPAARDPPPLPLVPDISTDAKTTSHDDDDDDDESLVYRVPIFDPLVAELCNNNNNGTFNDGDAILVGNNNNNNNNSSTISISSGAAAEMSARPYVPTETDLAEFAADVESLLGRGLESECDFGIEGLGFVDHRSEKDYTFDDDGRVKIELHCQEQEDEDAEEDRDAADMKMCWSEASAEPFELSFEDYEESPAAAQPKKEPSELEEAGLVIMNKKSNNKLLSGKKNKKKKKKILLRLDYDKVITAWASQGSPWATGDRPDLDPETADWPYHDSADAYTAHQLHHHHFMDLSGVGGTPAILADGGREARVSRYREKRRTRLFSKKIRYEVRKLNAEKRPRMKGRFVKRASFVGPHFPMLK